jgi:hypothetical protein
LRESCCFTKGNQKVLPEEAFSRNPMEGGNKGRVLEAQATAGKESCGRKALMSLRRSSNVSISILEGLEHGLMSPIHGVSASVRWVGGRQPISNKFPEGF